MSYNIGPKIGIDGEKEFRDSIKKINESYKAMAAETKAVTAAYDAQGDEQGKLEAKSKLLQKQVENQKEKMSLLEEAVKKASEKYGENSVEATRLRGALYDTQATVSNLEAELKETETQLANMGDAMEDFSEDAEDAEDAALSFGDVLKANLASSAIVDTLKDVGEKVADIAQEAIESAANIRAASAQFEQAFGDMKDSAENALNAISDETKIATTRMQESYTSIFAFSKSVGADSAEALDIATRAMRAAADSAAYYDKTVEEASETLQSFLKGNYANDAALGIAATETTRNAKANELYAQSFKDLSEAQKVDVLLAMVEAGNEASGALGQAAREAGEWTNVNGELTESWRQLLGVIGDPLLNLTIPVLQGATAGLKKITEELSHVSVADTLAASTKELENAISDTSKQFETAEKDISSAAYAAKFYADRLKVLEDVGLDSAAAQQEYAQVVEELNKLVPDLNLSIDEQTGLVNKNTDAILADIDAWKEYATAAALQEKFSDILKARGAVEADLITAQARLTMLGNEEKLLTEQRTAAAAKLKAAQEDLAEAQERSGGLVNASQVAEAQARVVELTGEVNNLNDAISQNVKEQKALNREISDAEEAMETYSEDITTADAAISQYNQSTKEQIDYMAEQMIAIEETEEALSLICSAYTAAKEDATDSIKTQIGLFAELSLESDYTAGKIMENWASQQRAFQEYSNNLRKAIDIGLDDLLVQQLANGSPEYMMILDALVNDTEISIDEINKAFWELTKSRDSMASLMAEISVVADGGLTGLTDAFRLKGLAMMDELIGAVASKQEAFQRTVAETAKLGLSGLNEMVSFDSSIGNPKPSLASEDTFLAAQLERVGDYPSVVQSPTSNSQSVTHSYGGVNFEIYQQPGESGEDLAYQIMDIMQHQVNVKGAGLGG